MPWWRQPVLVRLLVALAGGTGLALAFPMWSAAGLAWLGPGVLLAAALGTRGARPFLLGWVGGLAQWLLSLSWLLNLRLLNLPFPAVAGVGWLALSAYLALFTGLWVWISLRLMPRVGDGATASWGQRVGWTLLCAAAWVGLEWARGWFLSGFPWNSLGVSQYTLLPLIQVASVTGVHGLSFVLCWTSVALLGAGLGLVERGRVRASCRTRTGVDERGASGAPGLGVPGFAGLGWSCLPAFADVILPLVSVLALMWAGSVQLLRPGGAGRELKVALIQPSIPQRLIFDPKETTNRFNALLDLTRLAIVSHPDLVVWPEASLPGLDEASFRALTDLVRTGGVWMVLGADDVEARDTVAGEAAYDSFNAAFLLNREGRFAGRYRKQHLVIFGEYIPLMDWIPWLGWLTSIEGSFRSGPGPVPFVLSDPAVRMSVLICFEDVFAGLARAAVGDGVDFLLNLTNNGWFGESAVQWQHAANAVFRAVENGLPLVRCTNNGLTCWIDARGRMRDVGLGDEKEVYGAGFRIITLPLGVGSRAPTFYQRHGDWLAWLCAGMVCLAALVRRACDPAPLCTGGGA